MRYLQSWADSRVLWRNEEGVEKIYCNEPIFDVGSTHYRSIFEIKNNASVPHLIKQLQSWESVLDQSRWTKMYPTELSIRIANRNVRKIKMLLSVRGQYDNSMELEFNKIGRIQFSGLTRHFILKSFNYKCADCGATKDETTLHIDHIIPIVKGGSNRLDNLQVLCRDCNLAKHTDVWEAGK